MGVEYSDAIDMFVDRLRTYINANPRGAIVIHKTAGFDTAQECAKYFATATSEVSSHFVIGLDGTVVQCVSLDDGAGANCCLVGAYDTYWNQYLGLYPNNNLNYATISLEHIDNHKNANGVYDNQGEVTPEQWTASLKLCLWLRDNYNMQWADVKTHKSIDPVDRAYCPGNYPMQRLLNAMAEAVPSNNPIGANMDTSFHTQWRACIADLMTDSGIYEAWAQAKANGKSYNAPYTREYENNTWNSNKKDIMCQDGGNWHAEWNISTSECTFYSL